MTSHVLTKDGTARTVRPGKRRMFCGPDRRDPGTDLTRKGSTGRLGSGGSSETNVQWTSSSTRD